MDCRTARLLIELHRPWAAELPTADTDDLRSHLADCADCAALERDEARCHEALGQAVRAVAIPAGLQQRIMAGLGRRRWHERPMVRACMAAAAMLLLVAGYAWWRQPSSVGLDEFAVFVNSTPRIDAVAVDAWFAEHGIAARVPRVWNSSRFNYALLSDIEIVKFQGQDVPKVQLTSHDGHTASIYILDSRFDFDSLDLDQHGSGRFSIQALPAADGVPYRWIVKYSGGAPEIFLVPGLQG